MSSASATVTAVSRNDVYSFTKPPRPEIVLVAGLGVEGDVHAGVHVRHRSRVRADASQPNLRQVHLIQGELFDEVAGKGYAVRPGDLGENVTTSGIDLLGLPVGTILRFGPAPRTATAAVGDAGRDADGLSGARDGGAVGLGGVRDGGAGGLGGARDGGADGLGAARDRDAVGSSGARDGGGGLESARDGSAGAGTAVAAVLAAAADARLDASTAAAAEAVAAAAVRDAASADARDGRAAIVVAGLRNPCQQINGFRAGLLKEVLGHDAHGRVERRAGVMAVVLRGGVVRPGDAVSVELPPLPHAALDRV